MIFQEQHTWQIRFTSSAPVLLCLLWCMLKPLWHSPQPTLRQLMSTKAWSPEPIQPALCGVPAFRFSLSLHVRESQSGKAKHAALRLIQPQPVTQPLKVEQRIKELIILLTPEWDKVWNFYWEMPEAKESITLLSRQGTYSVLKYSASKAPHILSRVDHKLIILHRTALSAQLQYSN